MDCLFHLQSFDLEAKREGKGREGGREGKEGREGRKRERGRRREKWIQSNRGMKEGRK